MRALEIITGHVIFRLRYNQIYQLKTTIIILGTLKNKICRWMNHFSGGRPWLPAEQVPAATLNCTEEASVVERK